jgi:hypothetical protein
MKGHHADDQTYEPDPNLIDKCFCGVCGDEMDVERNRKPSGGFAGAMAGHNRYYDRFWCKNMNNGWHVQARDLMREIKKTASKKLANMLEEELKEILKTRVATKLS